MSADFWEASKLWSGEQLVFLRRVLLNEKIRDPRATYSERRLRLKFVFCVICVIILIRILQVNYYNLSPSSLITPFLMSLSFLPLVILLKFYVVSLLITLKTHFTSSPSKRGRRRQRSRDLFRTVPKSTALSV